jgi:integrase
MARHINRLSDLKIRALKHGGMFNDGDGLYLKVTEAGSRSWIFRYMQGGKRRDMGLGRYPGVSLAEARQLAKEAYVSIQRGVDPIEDRRAKVSAGRTSKAVTFAEAAERYIVAHESGWRNAKHRYQWRQTLIAAHAGPILGEMDIAAIDANDILRVLEPIWTAKPDTATRTRGRIEAVLDWAKVRGLRDGENPARWKGHLKHLLPARNKQNGIQHYAALPWREMPEFMVQLRAIDAIGARALEFTILTAARTIETLGAQWSEIDFAASVWQVPGERMKAGKEHRVPLTAEALAILGDVPRLQGNPFIFPGAKKGRGLSNLAMLMTLRRIRPGLTVHGFRSSFRDWAAENTNFPREIGEAALAHTIGNAVERSYRRGDFSTSGAS